MNDPFFTRFKASIDDIALPERLNNPFDYEPHPLCRLAALELQDYLLTQTEWHHDFGIDHYVDATNVGKMFGVLVVRNLQGEIGYLSAFSGKLAGRNDLSRFVPPIVDLLSENSFYRIGENELNGINQRVNDIENSHEYLLCKQEYETACLLSKKELEAHKQQMKAAKMARDERRQQAMTLLNAEQFSKLQDELNAESIRQHYESKQLSKRWKTHLDAIHQKLEQYTNELSSLKEQRKMQSAGLQQKMFDTYCFLNKNGQVLNASEIFLQTDLKIPPAGAGDCAAPKLFQYAFMHQMQPLALAEFWWGQAPKSEIRRHRFFYPSCRGKCEPILAHMLQGIEVEQKSVKCSLNQAVQPSILYADDTIAIINKPAEYLSVPGKTEADTVFHFAQNQFPFATGPLIVHRLDMSTSGLMVIALTDAAYHHLQNQFEARTVKKRYIAVLEGVVPNDEGFIDLPLRVDLDNRPRQLVCYEYGKSAQTRWQVLERSNNRTRVAFYPITGRTHQLRVHAAHSLGLNCPIVGDDLYGQRADRLYLHAGYLQFIHPQTNEIISFEADAEF